MRKLELVKVPVLRVGDFELKNFSIGAIRESFGGKTGNHETWNAVGLLGPDVLAKASAIIDCEADILYLKLQRN